MITFREYMLWYLAQFGKKQAVFKYIAILAKNDYLGIWIQPF